MVVLLSHIFSLNNRWFTRYTEATRKRIYQDDGLDIFGFYWLFPSNCITFRGNIFGQNKITYQLINP